MFNEVHSIHGHTLLLITKPSLQATALLQHLKQSLAITGKLHNIQRSLDDISSGSIILLDMMEADKKLIHYWQDTLSRKNNNIKILLLNTPKITRTATLKTGLISTAFFIPWRIKNVLSMGCKASCAANATLRKSLPATWLRIQVTIVITARNQPSLLIGKKRSWISCVSARLITRLLVRCSSAKIRLKRIFIIFSRR